MFIGLNGTMRRQRRRLATLAVILGLAGTVVVAHAAMGHDHMGDMGAAVVMCLAVAETAVVAVGVALAFGALMRRPLWPITQLPEHQPRFIPAPASVPARAGPPLLQGHHRCPDQGDRPDAHMAQGLVQVGDHLDLPLGGIILKL